MPHHDVICSGTIFAVQRTDVEFKAMRVEVRMKSILGLIRIMTYLYVLMCFLVLSAFAEDIYIAQISAGGDTGTNCSNAHSATWFNTSGNWGAGAGKVSAGDTVHLCGTFSAGANASPMLTFQLSGAAGNPTTLLFETGSKLEAYYWSGSGAINLNSKSYITIDGGTTCGQVNGVKTACNGIIRNTLAGTSGQTCPGGSCTYQFNDDTSSSLLSDSDGGNASHIEIKNLQLGPVYVRPLSTAAQGVSTAGLVFNHGAQMDISVHNNVMEGAGKLFLVSKSDNHSGSHAGYYLYNNDMSNMCWAVGIGANTNVGSIDDVQIYNNEIYDWRWAGNGSCHANGIMLFDGWQVYSAGYTGDSASKIYNNYVHGSLSGGYGGSSPSGFISCQENCGPVNIFNNLIVDTETGVNGGGGVYCQGMGGGGQKVYNNTIIRGAGNGCIYLMNDREGLWGKPIAKNNICITSGGAFIETYETVPNMVVTDYNDGYGVSSNWILYNIGAAGQSVSLSTWRSTYGQDAHGISSNPNLDGKYKPQASSPVVGAGVNLTSLGITALNYDRAGVARPSSGAWNIGAYEYISGTTLPKIPSSPVITNISP